MGNVVSIERADFYSITEQDLQELVDAQVSEGLRLDYKLTQYGNKDSDKREMLKDVSALANTNGGHLIIGIKERGGIAKELVGIDIDADAEILRMEQITRNGLEPPAPGIRIRPIILCTGKIILLIRVPRSWNPPHRVIRQGVNRFYIRHSNGVHEPSIEELRALFNQSASALEQARRFRDERIHVVCSGYGQKPLEANGRLFLHIVPVASFSGMVNLDLEEVSQKYQVFRPLGETDMTPRFNYYGFIIERGGPNNFGYTQIFRNGIFEATIAGFVREYNDQLRISGLGLEGKFFQRLYSYIMGLRDVGVPPPLIIMITLEGVHGIYYTVSKEHWLHEEIPLPESVFTLPECVLEDYGTEIDYHRAVRPAFDALWNAIGYSKSQFFDEKGLWVGDRKR